MLPVLDPLLDPHKKSIYYENNTVAVFSFKDRQYHYVPADEYYAAEKVSEEALIELCRKYGA